MALKFKTVKAHKSNYGSSRSTKDIKYIVIHYTGNKNDTALNNCKYFQGANRHASAHYFVDGGTYVYKSVPVSSVAWAVGGHYSTENGAGCFYKKCTNANSLSIEMCDSVGGTPKKIYDQTVELTKYLMKKYNVPASRVIRHWDVNGKQCPAAWIGTKDKDWKQFKKDIKTEKSNSKKIAVGDYDSFVKATKDCPIRKNRAASGKQLGLLKKGDKIKVLYIAKNAAGNLWGSVDFGDSVGFIFMGNVEAV